MKVVTFGLISSPYQACTCLKDTAKIHSLMYPLAAAIIADSYMDDIASGAISVVEGRKLIKQILTVMDAGGFRGHKISTNDPGMVEGIPLDQVDPSRVVSVLGKIFDTQGFVSPYVMQYKKLLPMLWHNNTTWDETVSYTHLTLPTKA